MDSKIKKNITNQNNYLCKFGHLKNMTNYTTHKNFFNENYDIGDTELYTNFADVFVLKVQTLDIARELKLHKINPVIVNLVNEHFTGGNIDSLEGVYDDDLNLRTNFSIIAKMNNNYPPKKNEVLYTQNVIALRDEKINPYNNVNMCFSVSVITVSTHKKYILDKTDESKLELNEYISLKQKIEAVLQTAHMGNNDAIIFRDFGCLEDGLPINDIIEIYNSCILKYGQFFKNIIFCIPIKTSKDIPVFNYFLKEIIKPQDLINENEINNIDINNYLNQDNQLQDSDSDENNNNQILFNILAKATS